MKKIYCMLPHKNNSNMMWLCVLIPILVTVAVLVGIRLVKCKLKCEEDALDDFFCEDGLEDKSNERGMDS